MEHRHTFSWRDGSYACQECGEKLCRKVVVAGSDWLCNLQAGHDGPCRNTHREIAHTTQVVYLLVAESAIVDHNTPFRALGDNDAAKTGRECYQRLLETYNLDKDTLRVRVQPLDIGVWDGSSFNTEVGQAVYDSHEE